MEVIISFPYDMLILQVCYNGLGYGIMEDTSGKCASSTYDVVADNKYSSYLHNTQVM